MNADAAKKIDIEAGVVLIPVDGLPRDALAAFTFKDAQAFVGGFVEVVRLRLSNDVLLVNEEGRLRGLPRNPFASEVFGVSLYDNAVLLAGEAAVTKVLGGGE
jgi:hypothetical protein